jgi:hypothetical protein
MGHHSALADHTGAVEALRHRDRAGAAVAAAGVADHHVQVFQVGQGAGNGFQGIIAGLDERGAQKQVFGRIATNRQFGGEQQTHTPLVGAAGRVNDFLGIARHVTHHKIELGNADKKCHKWGWIQSR